MFSKTLFLDSRSMTFVLEYDSSIFNDSISASSGVMFGREKFCFFFFPLVGPSFVGGTGEIDGSSEEGGKGGAFVIVEEFE